jgi:hypothetical protein
MPNLYDTTHEIRFRTEDALEHPDAQVMYLLRDVRGRWGFLVVPLPQDNVARGYPFPPDGGSWPQSPYDSRTADEAIRRIWWAPDRTTCLARMMTAQQWQRYHWHTVNQFVRESMIQLLGVPSYQQHTFRQEDYRVVIEDPRHGRLVWPPAWGSTPYQLRRWEQDDSGVRGRTAAERLHPTPQSTVRVDSSQIAAEERIREVAGSPNIMDAIRADMRRRRGEGIERLPVNTDWFTSEVATPIERSAGVTHSHDEKAKYSEETLSGRCEMCSSPDVSEGVCWDCGYCRISEQKRA